MSLFMSQIFVESLLRASWCYSPWVHWSAAQPSTDRKPIVHLLPWSLGHREMGPKTQATPSVHLVWWDVVPFHFFSEDLIYRSSFTIYCLCDVAKVTKEFLSRSREEDYFLVLCVMMKSEHVAHISWVIGVYSAGAHRPCAWSSGKEGRSEKTWAVQ